MKCYVVKNQQIKCLRQHSSPNLKTSLGKSIDVLGNHSVEVNLSSHSRITADEKKVFAKFNEAVTRSSNDSSSSSEDESPRTIKVTLFNYVDDFHGKAVYAVGLQGEILDVVLKACSSLGCNSKIYASITTFKNRIGKVDACYKWSTEDVDIGPEHRTSLRYMRMTKCSNFALPKNVSASCELIHDPSIYECVLTIVLLIDVGSLGTTTTENIRGGATAAGRKRSKFAHVNFNLKDLADINLKILGDKTTSDVTIVAANGAKLKCHKNFLFALSPVFKTMLKSGFKEGSTNTIKITDMSEEAVRAMLNYFYCMDVSLSPISAPVAFELLQAGDKYDVPSLVSHMQNFLMAKEDNWYSVDVALELYLFSRNMDFINDDLKEKILHVLNVKHDELTKSEKFHQLFEQNPAAAKDLSLLSISMMRKRARTH